MKYLKYAKKMFLNMPSPDILLLGNLTSSMGYKNIVVDRTNYIIANKSPKIYGVLLETLGVSNCYKIENRKTFTKLKYKKLCEAIKLY